jgi:hypothetical protein
MNCHDARQQFSDLLAGKTGLTESAQVDAHVSQCADCHDLLGELYRLRPRDDEPEQGNPPEVYVDPSPEPSRADDLILEPRRPRSGLGPVLVGVAVVILGIGTALAFSVSTWSPERLSAFLTSGLRATATDATLPQERTDSREAAPPSQGLADSQEPAPTPSLSSPIPSPAAKPEPASKSSSRNTSSSDRGSTTTSSGGAAVTEKHAGVVVRVEQTRITIDEMGPWRGPNTRPLRHVFQLAGATKVALAERTREGADGWPWAFSEEWLRRTDLRPGDFVTVTARRNGDDAVAISVLAVRPSSNPEIPGSS